MTLDKVRDNHGRRFPHWVVTAVMELHKHGANEAQLGVAAEIARITGAMAGTISISQHGVVVLGLVSKGAAVDVSVHPDGGLSVVASLGGGDWQGSKAAKLARLALWGER